MKADTPMADLCYLGGWKSPLTVMTVYQQADQVTMRNALSSLLSVSLFENILRISANILRVRMDTTTDTNTSHSLTAGPPAGLLRNAYMAKKKSGFPIEPEPRDRHEHPCHRRL